MPGARDRDQWELSPTPANDTPCPGCGQTAAQAQDSQPPPVFPRFPMVCIATRNGWWWYCAEFHVTRIDHERMGT